MHFIANQRCAPAFLHCRRQKQGKSQHGGNGLWGTEGEVPSFLYAMPLGGNRVFLEETCLVGRPAMPFATLKRRLERRCRALGITVSLVRVQRGWEDGWWARKGAVAAS